MRLSIEHRMDVPAGEGGAFYVRLSPRRDAVQATLSWRVEGAADAVAWQDGFGNLSHMVNTGGAPCRLVAGGEVETEETHGILAGLAGDVPPGAFLRPTRLTAADEAIRAFAAGFAGLRARGDLAALHGLMAGIQDGMEHGAGGPIVPASTALARGSGRCQDHAHVFIACCRHWGIPARYVSGYLLTNGEDGLHAWAEAWVEDLGWVSFDPVNRRSATPAYVRLAVALDHEGAAPVRACRPAGKNGFSVRVQVQSLAQQ